MRSDLIENMVRTIEKHLGALTYTFSGGLWSLTVTGEDDATVYVAEDVAGVTLEAFMDARGVAEALQ